MIIDLLKFLLFFALFYFIPGYVIARKTNIKSLTTKTFLAIAIGFCLSALFGYIGEWFYRLMLGVFLLVFIVSRAYRDFAGQLKLKLRKHNIILGIVVLLGITFQNSIIFRTGLNYSYGVGYWGALAHDGVWHHALVNQLTLKTPPNNPGYSGENLTNYHYFYDLLVAQNTKLTHISIPDLIYRYYPLVFSLLLGIGSYLLGASLFKNKWIGLILVYLSYFGSSFGWIVEWIKSRTLGGESAFWANQPVSFNINPPFAISLILLIAFLLCFKAFSEKNNLWKGCALIILGGVLIEFKVYGGLILLASLGIFVLKKIIFDRKFGFLPVMMGLLLVSMAVFLPGARGASGFVTFFPFWIIDSMVDIVDRVGWPRLSLARTVGLETQNWPKFFAAEAAGLFLFIAGNLGTRVLALGAFFLIPIKKWWKEDPLFLVFIMLFASILPTLLFVQKTDPWNIIQFTYYFIYLIALLAAPVIYRIITSVPKWGAFVFLFLFLVVTPISSFWTFRSGLLGNVAYISDGEIVALEHLKNLPLGNTLTYPYNQYLRYAVKEMPLPVWAYQTSAYVSAYGNKVTYLEDVMQQGILGNDFTERLALSESYFSQKMTKDEERLFLKEENIKYIYVPKPLTPLVNTKPEATIIFENNDAIIYEVKNP